MQLFLDCFKRIFEALAGIYTKAETDSALAERDSRIANAEENIGLNAEAIEQLDTALAEHDAEIDTLQKVTAGLGEGATAAANVAKWQTYATAIQKDLDAETAMQLAQEFGRATDEYLADPTATKEWRTTLKDGVYSSNSPHYATPPTKPVVDFNVTTIVGEYSNQYTSGGVFSRKTNVDIFLPNVITFNYGIFRCDKFDSNIVITNATSAAYGCCYNPLLKKKVHAPNISVGNYMFDGDSLYDHPHDLPKLSQGQGMFRRAGMSAKNISATLNSLPVLTGSASRMITFTGCPGIASTATTETFTITDEDGMEYSLESCPIFTTDDEAQMLRKAFVLAVKKKKWTVEI